MATGVMLECTTIAIPTELRTQKHRTSAQPWADAQMLDLRERFLDCSSIKLSDVMPVQTVIATSAIS